MTRKTKAPPKKTPQPNVLDSAALVVQAEAKLGRANYKEATDLYKELLKREQRPEWLEKLALCYSGRAHNLAEKGMFKEALALWRNREQVCGKALIEGPYLVWLLKSGDQNELFRLLTNPALTPAVRAELETQVAAPFLFGAYDTQISNLPPDSLLLRHRPAALEAWQALQGGDFTVLNERLQAIPFRSPYRDLKPLLKALALTITDPVAAEAAMSRLPVDGPFEPLAACVRVALLPDLAWLKALAGLDPDRQQLVLDLKGCPEDLRPPLLDLVKFQGTSFTPKVFFDLLLRHRHQLPDGVAEQFCRRLLPHVLPRWSKFFDVFGKPSQQELCHFRALNAEAEKGFSSGPSLSAWEEYAELLSEDAATHRQAAAVWRRLAEYDGKIVVSTGDMPDTAFDSLVRCVELDSSEREPILRLISELRLRNDLKQARVYLERAMSGFPQNAEVLLEAMQVALASQAFKKAVGLAKQVLELDPINPKVRRLVAHAYFAHARKLIKAGNVLGAGKELDAAQEWVRDNEDGATLNLLRAIASSNDASAPKVDVNAILSVFGGVLIRALRLSLESARIGLVDNSLLKWAGINLTGTPDPVEVLALVRALETLQKTDDTLQEKTLRAAIKPLRASLKRAGKVRYAIADLQLICEAWLRYQEHELLGVYATNALKMDPSSPIFVYFKAYAQYGKLNKRPPGSVLGELKWAMMAANTKGDQRTSGRIRDFLDKFDSFSHFPHFPHFEEFEDFEALEELEDFEDFAPRGKGLPASKRDEIRTMLEMFLQMGGEKAFCSMVREAIGKKDFELLKNKIGGNDKDFAHALINMMVDGELRDNFMPPFSF